jgi:hypothetical protein
MLDEGDVLRVTCDFKNTTDAEVTFGESTHVDRETVVLLPVN